MKFKFAILAAAALISSAALSADNGFYVGAGIGASDVSAKDANWSATDFGWKLFAGYDFNKYLALEAAYLNGGSPSDQGLKVDVYTTDVALIGKWPVADAFDLHAKIGYGWWDLKPHGFDSQSGSDLLWGFGAGYRFGDHLIFSADWERQDTKYTDRADLWTVSAGWKF
ncbi:MAG TPA: porin family protein [Steroidobacteraceae bacterium]|nr:porin family protein [Steroidobacteraceae bacterium]